MNYLAFKKFLAASGLSTRRFADLCGIGKTTVHRLAQPGHGGLTHAYLKTITPAILRACRDHLTTTRAPADSVHLILTDIFEEAYAPEIIHRHRLTSAMLRFFGFTRDPFAAPRDASDVFLTEPMHHALESITEAVKYQGFTAILAPVGAGKTVIKGLMTSPKTHVPGPKSEAETRQSWSVPSSPRAAGSTDWSAGILPALDAPRPSSAPISAEAIRSRTVDRSSTGQPPSRRRYDAPRETIIITPSFLDMSRVTASGIVSYILEHFHIRPRRTLLLAQRQLEEHLAQLDSPVALCFDECHRLPDSTLTALKNFYELGTGGFRRYLGLILFGQPQFKVRLSLPRFREIAERLHIIELPPLTLDETAGYLNHCLTRAVPAGPLTAGPFPTPRSPKSRVQSPMSPHSLTRDAGIPTLDSSPRIAGDPPAGMEATRLYLNAQRSEITSSPEAETLPSWSLPFPEPSTHSTDWTAGGPPAMNAQRSPTSNLEPETLNPAPTSDIGPWTWDCVQTLASRASTPLAIANLASAALEHAYRKGERTVTPRFIPRDTS